MTEFCISPLEKSRKALSAVLQVLKNNGKQGAIATAMGISDSTMSRLVNDHMEQIVSALYHGGFKVVSQDMQCYPSADIEAWYGAYKRQVSHANTAAELFRGEE
jgi:hypothetical protein